MDLPKFLSLLEQKALYFARLTEFDDKWEALIDDHAFDAMVSNFGDSSASHLKSGLERAHPLVVVNCWHCNPGESVAMWALYTETTYGIAVKSDVGRLKRAFASSSEEIYMGEVHYRDFQANTIAALDGKNVLALPFFLQKRLCYQHECELRAYSVVPPQSDKREQPERGTLINVDLAELIESIRLGPRFPVWAKALIESALARAGIIPPISDSEAFAPPPIDIPMAKT
jgi:hypothetical protein